MRSTAPTGELPPIHAVTNDEIVATPDFPLRAAAVMRALGPGVAIHLRASRLPGRRLLALADALAEEQGRSGAWLVVNDRIDVALVARARGAQLTSRSLSVADARAVAPALRLGASVHSIEEHQEATVAGADWVVAGHVFPTLSHPDRTAHGEQLLRDLIAASTLPVIAIGGVRPTDVAALRTLGVAGVAAIRGIWSADDAVRAAIAYLSSYEGSGGS